MLLYPLMVVAAAWFIITMFAGSALGIKNYYVLIALDFIVTLGVIGPLSVWLAREGTKDEAFLMAVGVAVAIAVIGLLGRFLGRHLGRKTDLGQSPPIGT